MRGNESYNNRLKLTEAERESLLNRLDQAARGDRTAPETNKNNRRRHKRWEFRVSNTTLTVEHPGGGISRLMVCARNLSAGGLGFIHGGYLHKGSRCKVMLRGLDGLMHAVLGQIVSCRHVEGVMHEIGLQFERKIDPTRFVEAPSTPTSPAESVGLEALAGKVLYIDDSIDDQNLMKFVLDLCGAQLCIATNGVEGLAMAEQRPFDAILTEMWLPGISGIEIGEALRKAGYSGPLFAITADEQPQLKEQALAKGFTDFISKPLDFETLTKTLAKHLPMPPEAGANAQPLYSSRWEDVRMRPLILDFVSRLPSQLRQLEKFLESADPANAQKLCMAIKGSAGGYGFPQLSAAAEEMRKQIAAGAKALQLKAPMDALKQLCSAVTLVRDKEDMAA